MSGVRFRTTDVSDPALESDGLRHVTVRSPALGRRADVTVFAAGAERVEEGAGLPAVVLLHGVFASHWAWALKGGAHRTAQCLVEAGEIAPVALVMPSDGLFACGSGYVSLPGRDDEDGETWIVEEAVAAARLAVPGAGDGGVCIAGLSMGGWGAVRLAARHPDRYAAAAGMSSITTPDDLQLFVDEDVPSTYGLDPTESLADAVLAAGDAMPPLHLDCGTGDFLIEPNRRLHHRLDAAGHAHAYAEHDGGHDWTYWSAHLGDVLRFFDTVLRG